MNKKNTNFYCKFLVGEVNGLGWVAVTPQEWKQDLYFGLRDDNEKKLLNKVRRALTFFLKNEQEASRLSLIESKEEYCGDVKIDGVQVPFVPKETILAHVST